MAFLSDLIISHPEVTSYEELERLVVEAARSGTILLYMDLKPDFPDTPRDWQHRLELLFHKADVPTSLKR